MQKHPMLSVKEAAEALKIDERSVRDRLANGTLKGEKKMVGLREKWFIYSSALNNALAKQDDIGAGIDVVQNSVTVQDRGESDIVDASTVTLQERSRSSALHAVAGLDPYEAVDATYGVLDEVTPREAEAPIIRGEWHTDGKGNLESLVETFMKPLVEKVATQERALANQAAVVAAQQKEIEEQKVQLRLLPDLQRRAQEEAEAAKAAELKLHEAAALQKQADMIAERKTRELADKEAEMVELQGQVASVEEENKILEAKANEALRLAESLQALEKKVEQLQRPFWKKWFEVQQ